MKSVFTICLLTLVLAFTYGAAYAFHDGGVAECAGCHTMHNSEGGVAVDSTGGNPYLLRVGTASDQCLACHAGYGQFAGGAGFGPGGDFYWLTKTYSWTGHGSTEYSEGDSHGHNVISPANGLLADQSLTVAPGGDFESQYLTCTSCHDPHGNQSFRLLFGTGAQAPHPVYDGAGYSFAHDAPLAKGNSRRTLVSATNGNETNAKHTVYKSGMSDWCSNCHSDFHSENASFVHPQEALDSDIAGAYNSYISTDQPTGGSSATAYWGLVPFEDVNVDLATVSSTNYTAGPAAEDEVMCLTCHRAHASAFPSSGRWDFGATFIADSHPATGDGGLGVSDVGNKYYQYTFATNQRSLCNKCHKRDLGDRPRPVTP